MSRLEELVTQRAPEKSLSVSGDDLSYSLDRAGRLALLGLQDRTLLINKPNDLPAGWH